MNKEKEEMPGPGEYNQSDYQQGIYILSKFKNYGAIKYRKQTKRLSNDFLRKINNCKFYAWFSETPGPGSYMAQSDFGYIDTNK